MSKKGHTNTFKNKSHSKITGLFLAIKRFAQRCQNTEREIRTI